VWVVSDTRSTEMETFDVRAMVQALTRPSPEGKAAVRTEMLFKFRFYITAEIISDPPLDAFMEAEIRRALSAITPGKHAYL
jgi:hypothetical protein